jgi:hypothetical protein
MPPENVRLLFSKKTFDCHYNVFHNNNKHTAYGGLPSTHYASLKQETVEKLLIEKY